MPILVSRLAALLHCLAQSFVLPSLSSPVELARLRSPCCMLLVG